MNTFYVSFVFEYGERVVHFVEREKIVYQLQRLNTLGILVKLLTGRVLPMEGTGLVGILLVDDLFRAFTLKTEERI